MGPHLGRILLKRSLFFPIVKLLTSKSALQNSVYGSTGDDDDSEDDEASKAIWMTHSCFAIDGQWLIGCQDDALFIQRRC